MKKIFRIFLCLCMVLCAGNVFAEIKLLSTDGVVEIIGADGSVVVDAGNPEVTITDSGGAQVKFTYDAETGKISAENLSGSASILIGSAKVFLSEGQKVIIDTAAAAKSVSIENATVDEDGNPVGGVVISFMDGSKVELGPDAAIRLTQLADRNYSLKVINGTVRYTDPQGNVRMLTESSAVIFVPGFTALPMRIWRGSLPTETAPSTP